MDNINTVLEPSCGSCEYISLLDQTYDNLDITAIEYNKEIYESISDLEKDNIKIYNQDYLLYKSPLNYDLIIGNPPYFVMKKKDVDPIYYEYFEGRPNIFIIFIIKSLKLLNKNGILSFILPKNFLNCLYYDKTRKYILQNFKILNIVDCIDSYIETTQATINIIIQNTLDKENNNNKFILNNNNKYNILGTIKNIHILKKLYSNSSTLSKLNFKVTVGNIVWNQCKSILTNDNTDTRLIYSSDIKNNKLDIQIYNNKDKKNYINKNGYNKPILVINRGYGVGKYDFKYCLIKGDMPYLIENHLICIEYTKKIKTEDLIKMYNKIIKSFENNSTTIFIDLYFGNNAINTKELYEILPIYNF